ncbi:MAG: dTDP-4-dehydrorhamnose 3,5-epimerase [Chloroflexi bacterium]|nr:dTDP-4-dehydrorhamnose 3,5-epimerase [Chloroflexota bacterium]
MQFTETVLKGAYLIDLETRHDDRGYFARTFCAHEFEEHGLHTVVAQCNLSVSYRKGTLRGMHYLAPPSQEAKLVRVCRGAIYDVIVDLRPDSPTYRQHIAVELTARNRRALYVPPLFAHGFQTLDDDTEVFYQMSDFYAPGQERGMRYDDPALKIQWPLPVSVISEKDASWPYLSESA